MTRFWQAVVIACSFPLACWAEERAVSFQWEPVKVRVSGFSNDLGLLDSEREEYATNLAVLGSNAVAVAKATPASIAQCRRMLGLALQLSPRNKKALVTNFQLGRGILPELSEAGYSPQVFARLILTRAQLLEKQDGADNQRLARYFICLAAELDPKNEDAVYLSEVRRLDHGLPDWKVVTDPVESPSAP